MKHFFLTVLVLCTIVANAGDVLNNEVGYAPGGVFQQSFSIHDATGSAVLADDEPVVTLRFLSSGVWSATVTCDVTAYAVGDYAVSGTVPATVSIGTVMEAWATATVNGIAGRACIYRKRVVHPDQIYR